MKQKRLREQLELLQEVVNKSPYLSRSSRDQLEKEIAEISIQINKEPTSLTSFEQRIFDVNARAATDEVNALMLKLNHLNPASPRLVEIRTVATRLSGGEISPEQSRRELERIMQH